MLHSEKKSILEKSVLIGLIISVLISFTGSEIFAFDKRCEGVREKLLRLHIIANSDSEADQALKLKVRDEIITRGGYIFDNADTLLEAKAAAEENLDVITSIAIDTISAQGYDYSVEAYVGGRSTEVREYGEDVTLPAGEYEALNIIIGEGNGKNWWCVMFPPLCLPAAEEVETDTDVLSGVLSDDEQEMVTDRNKYEVRFKIVEWFKGIFG